MLWRWGNPEIGRKQLHHDVACQIYDWDGDGRNEVVLCTEGSLVELDGATGREKRRLPLPKDATDCLVFANLSGRPRATDVLVKTRYTQIWAFNRDGKQLWTVENPGGYRTAHQPVPVDLDGDGRDEIMAGYAMLNADGSTRWVFKSQKVDQARGHCDCFRLVRAGKTPEEFRFVMTFCGANGIALLDGHGKPIWEVTGEHFESVDVGRICADLPGLQLAVDIDHRRLGRRPGLGVRRTRPGPDQDHDRLRPASRAAGLDRRRRGRDPGRPTARPLRRPGPARGHARHGPEGRCAQAKNGWR